MLTNGYGLRALAMVGGDTRIAFRTVSCHTGQFGALGLVGGVKLAFRKKLAAIADERDRKVWFDTKVEAAYQQSKALTGATYFEIDDVIDPATTRAEIERVLLGHRVRGEQRAKKRTMVGGWCSSVDRRRASP